MAIVISGVNNNDKITASDGTIDLLSGVNYVGVLTAPSISASGNITAGHLNIGSGIQLGNAGVVTATTFIGNLTGNVTGNVNATSNLLLQIGGSEKFRVGSSGQFGIGGANYGTSGQVLTSGGSGSAATWSTIPTPDADKITEGNTEAEVIDTGSDGHFKVTTEGSERLRIKNDGKVNITPGGALSGNHPPGDLNIVGTNFLTMTPNDNANASDNEVLGHIAFLPYAAGTIAAASAKIEAVAESGQSGSANPTSLRFYTKPSSAGPGNSGTERMRINQDGHVTKPNQPVFDVCGASSNPNASSGAVYITYTTVKVNNGNHYSTSTGKFTVPVAGLYFFSFGCIKSGNSNLARLHLYKNGSSANDRHLRMPTGGDGYGENGALTNIISCAVGDEIQVWLQEGVLHAGTAYLYFNGFLIG